MREILFRGKRVDTGEWVYGSFCPDACELRGQKGGCLLDGFIRLYDEETGKMIMYEVERETVGQYTGLTDSNSTKIFEGDYVRFADLHNYNCYLESLEYPEDYEGCDYSDLFTECEVIYGIEHGYPAFDLKDHEFDCNGLAELSESGEYFYEVISNIHDNPAIKIYV